MSHTVKVESVGLVSKTALEKALNEVIAAGIISGKVVHNQKPRLYFGTEQKNNKVCDLVLQVSENTGYGKEMDIGFYYDTEKRSYAPLIDNGMNHKKLAGYGGFEYGKDGLVSNPINAILREYTKQAIFEDIDENNRDLIDIYEKDGELFIEIETH
jgi:hypothetical protein